MLSPRPLICATLLGAIIFAGLAATSQPAPAAKAPTLPANLPVYSLWMPAAKYTAIVLTTNAAQRRWIVSIKTRNGSFPVTIGPAQTVIVPFDKGWNVADAMEAHIESQYIPFDDLTQRNLLDGNELLGLSAWGITESGPVMFVPPRPAK